MRRAGIMIGGRLRGSVALEFVELGQMTTGFGFMDEPRMVNATMGRESLAVSGPYLGDAERELGTGLHNALSCIYGPGGALGRRRTQPLGEGA